jgi:hypothetical protein
MSIFQFNWNSPVTSDPPGEIEMRERAAAWGNWIATPMWEASCQFPIEVGEVTWRFVGNPEIEIGL